MTNGQLATNDPVYQARLASIAAGDHGMLIICPHCKSRAIIRTSRANSVLTRDAYCQCTNLACGHTFRATMEIVETLSPSAVPDPNIALQLSQSKHSPIREKEPTHPA